MDMKYDSSVMHNLTNATEQRMVEAYNLLERFYISFQNINKSDWDDSQRGKFETVLNEIRELLMSSVHSLSDYLEHLQGKMAEFENRR